MKLLLVRHGHDLPGANGDSHLSWQGKKQAAQTAQRMLDMGITGIQSAYSSPARRAVETLDEIAAVLSVNERHTADELRPTCDTEALESLVRHRWSDEPEALLLVGHEPQLSNTVLRWCGLPENADYNGQASPWILSRGEGILLNPSFQQTRIELSSSMISILGRHRPLPGSKPSKRSGVF